VDNELEVIRDEMEETRASLANKLEALETQVRETVSGASEAVTSTVEGVKGVVDTVSDTVETVTETLNIPKQVEQHPWAAVGIALGAGFVAAQLLGGWSSEPSRPARQEPTPTPAPTPPAMPDLQMQSPPQQEQAPSGVLPMLESMLPDMNGLLSTAATSLGGLAVGTLMGVVREVAVNGLPPEWKGELTRMVDQITTQLGGKVLQPVKKDSNESEQQAKPGPDERLTQLEDLPSPLPSHSQANPDESERDDESRRSRRGGRSQATRKV
jgi:ElaB/YqjD/DUF883 family membrane-anchored ribosome-binding protein